MGSDPSRRRGNWDVERWGEGSDPIALRGGRMFAWRKKSDGGFEWHEYIRTTVKLRRAARRQRVRDAGRAAGQQMHAAGAALVAGSRAAGGAARQGALAGAGALG